jgi:hypothetical protein
MCVVGCLLCYLYSSCQILCDVSGRLTRHSKHLHKITNRICGYSIAGRQGRSRNGPRVKELQTGIALPHWLEMTHIASLGRGALSWGVETALCMATGTGQPYILESTALIRDDPRSGSQMCLCATDLASWQPASGKMLRCRS